MVSTYLTDDIYGGLVTIKSTFDFNLIASNNEASVFIIFPSFNHFNRDSLRRPNLKSTAAV
jgi:hypothetical protein